MRVAVVGAGISGLVCAYRLQQAGVGVEVFERSPEVGGRMATVDVGGFHVDIGTNILLENYTHTRAIARELGLGGEWYAFRAGAGGILRDGRLTSFAPANLADLARYRGLSTASRARVLRYLLRAWPRRNRLDFFDLSAGDDALDTVDAYTATVLACGREVADYLVDPFVRTFHFHSARDLSMTCFDALASLFLTHGGFATRGFRGQMRALPRALAAKLPLTRGAEVTAVRPGPDGVILHAPGPRHFDAVVLAVPAHAARAILPNATVEQERVTSDVRYSSTIVCSYRVPCDVLGDYEGIWVPVRESWIICDGANEQRKGCRDGGHGVLTICLHEEAARELWDRDDARVLRLVAREWARLFPRYEGHLDGLLVHRWPAALPVYDTGHLTRVKRFWRDGQGCSGVWLCGDWLNHPWVEGSVRCGEKVAAAIVATSARRPVAA